MSWVLSTCLSRRFSEMHPEYPEMLILGSGWTSQFLKPVLEEEHISFVCTSTTGRSSTIPFKFNGEREQSDQDLDAFKRLPNAKTVVIMFPLRGPDCSRRLVEAYRNTHTDTQAGFVQLGSTGVFDGGPTLKSQDQEKKRDSIWIDRHSPYNTANPRAVAEDELLNLSTGTSPTTVLELCGLWGGQRSMRNYVSKLFPNKEALGNKGSIHLIHGSDVARAILAVHNKWQTASGQRWIVTDMHSYDWWSLALRWGNTGADAPRDQPAVGPHPQWVRELMQEQNVKALPRTHEKMGRALDSREFWTTFNAEPRMGLD